MRKEKFVYNTATLRYEKVVEPLKVKLLRAFGFMSAVFVTAAIMVAIFYKFFPSPKEEALQRELGQMERNYTIVNDQLAQMNKALGNIQDRDGNVHRQIFGMDPIDPDVWNVGVGGAARNTDVTMFGSGNTGDLIKATKDRVDKLKRQLVLQSKSLDEIEQLAHNRDEQLAAMPAIKPVSEDKLKRNIHHLSGFGYRIHPIYKRKKFHAGIDFTSPKGTPIQATGNGKVIQVRRSASGYGHHVKIDHGYGYVTLYAHMSKIDVKKGEKVTRGQKIGEVGSTGSSTAPHLHYEVIYKNKKVNPIHYCMDGLTPEEYKQLADMASVANQSFD